MREKKRSDRIVENGKGKIDIPLDQLGEKDTIMHYNAVMIEEFRGQMKTVLEYVAAIALRMDVVEQQLKKINERLDAVELRLDAMDLRFNSLEKRVDAGFKELRQELKAQGDELKLHRQEHKYIQ